MAVNVVLSGAVLLLLYLVYSWFRDPLRDYPGPVSAKFTNAWATVFAAKRTLHSKVWEQHQKHGSVVRIGPDRLVFSTATALRDIYQNDRVTKAPIYRSTGAGKGVFSIWSALDRDLHRRKRKLVGRATTEAAMRAFEPSMIEQIDVFIRHLTANQGWPVDMKTQSGRLSFDIVGFLSFGYPLRLQTEETNRFLPDLLVRMNQRMNVFMQIPAIARHRLQRFLNLPFWQDRDSMMGLIATMIRTRMAEDKDAQRDLYWHLADVVHSKDNDAIGLHDLWSEAFFFIIAGGDTAATAMCSTLFYLANNPLCYAKVAAEIRNTFHDDSEIRGAKLGSCRYLRACIDESLRMSPPLPGTLWRKLAPEEENGAPLVVDGHVIPPGTTIGVNTYSLHHNEDYFPDPFSYNPDRWMPETGPESDREAIKLMHSAFAPFSVGGRGCAGKATAYLELTLTLAKILWFFDFEAAPGKLGHTGLDRNGTFRVHDIFTSTHDGPFIVFKARNGLVGGLMST